MTNPINPELVPIRHEGVKPEWLEDDARVSGKLWLNDEPELMTTDDSSFATTFRVATLCQKEPSQ